MDNPDDDQVSNVPDEVWALYAEHRLAAQRPGKVDNPIPWKLTTADNARLEHADTAARWWAEFDVSSDHLARCLVDGKAPGQQYRRHLPGRRKDPT